MAALIVSVISGLGGIFFVFAASTYVVKKNVAVVIFFILLAFIEFWISYTVASFCARGEPAPLSRLDSGWTYTVLSQAKVGEKEFILVVVDDYSSPIAVLSSRQFSAPPGKLARFQVFHTGGKITQIFQLDPTSDQFPTATQPEKSP